MPLNSKVHHLYQHLLDKGFNKASAAKIAQKKTGEALATGKAPNKNDAKAHPIPGGNQTMISYFGKDAPIIEEGTTTGQNIRVDPRNQPVGDMPPKPQKNSIPEPEPEKTFEDMEREARANFEYPPDPNTEHVQNLTEKSKDLFSEKIERADPGRNDLNPNAPLNVGKELLDQHNADLPILIQEAEIQVQPHPKGLPPEGTVGPEQKNSLFDYMKSWFSSNQPPQGERLGQAIDNAAAGKRGVPIGGGYSVTSHDPMPKSTLPDTTQQPLDTSGENPQKLDCMHLPIHYSMRPDMKIDAHCNVCDHDWQPNLMPEPGSVGPTGEGLTGRLLCPNCLKNAGHPAYANYPEVDPANPQPEKNDLTPADREIRGLDGANPDPLSPLPGEAAAVQGSYLFKHHPTDPDAYTVQHIDPNDYKFVKDKYQKLGLNEEQAHKAMKYAADKKSKWDDPIYTDPKSPFYMKPDPEPAVPEVQPSKDVGAFVGEDVAPTVEELKKIEKNDCCAGAAPITAGMDNKGLIKKKVKR